MSHGCSLLQFLFLLHVLLDREHCEKDKDRCNQKFEYLVNWAYHGHERICGYVRYEYPDCAKYLILIGEFFFERSVIVFAVRLAQAPPKQIERFADLLRVKWPEVANLLRARANSTTGRHLCEK